MYTIVGDVERLEAVKFTIREIFEYFTRKNIGGGNETRVIKMQRVFVLL